MTNRSKKLPLLFLFFHPFLFATGYVFPLFGLFHYCRVYLPTQKRVDGEMRVTMEKGIVACLGTFGVVCL